MQILYWCQNISSARLKLFDYSRSQRYSPWSCSVQPARQPVGHWKLGVWLGEWSATGSRAPVDMAIGGRRAIKGWYSPSCSPAVLLDKRRLKYAALALTAASAPWPLALLPPHLMEQMPLSCAPCTMLELELFVVQGVQWHWRSLLQQGTCSASQSCAFVPGWSLSDRHCCAPWIRPKATAAAFPGLDLPYKESPGPNPAQGTTWIAHPWITA